jgi:drug/metabolite transporter (DMT)-like permease
MILLRLLRIIAIALGFASLFALSRYATLSRGGEDLPGISWALGVLSAIFTVSAIASERSRGPEASLQKDFLWGLAAGCIITVVARWLQ